MDFDTQAGLIYSTLSDNEKDMIQYIRNHKSDVVGMPINELAKVQRVLYYVWHRS